MSLRRQFYENDVFLHEVITVDTKYEFTVLPRGYGVTEFNDFF